MNNKKGKQNITINYENKKLSILYFLPLLLISGFVPLITYAKLVDLKGTIQSLYWTGQHMYLDFFSYWKSSWVMILTSISLVFYIILYSKKKLPLKNLKQYYIPLGIYAIFVIISTMFSIDKSTALWGFVDMYQGMFVVLSYIFITFITINFVNSERDVSLFMRAFLFLMIVEGIIGVGQYFGFDLFQSEFGNKLILPGSVKIENLSFSFGPKTIYGTLFNTNYVGSFASLMLPLSVGLFLSTKTIKQRIVTGLVVILMLFTWIGCNSRAGYFGVIISAIFALWLFRKAILKYWKCSVGLVVVLIVLLTGLNSVSSGAIFNRIKTLNVTKEIENIKSVDENALKFKDIILGKDTFSIITNRETLNFKVDGNKIYFLDENNTELVITTKKNQITINDAKYSGYNIFIPEEYSGISVNAYGKIINFYITQDGVKILGTGGRLAEQKSSLFFEPLRGLETIGSNRGYIWGSTIPMINRYILSGSGPDNYPIAFNQDDFIAKLNLVDFDANIVIDKPHNMYMQIAVNTGLISLIALLAVWGIYIVSSLRLYSKLSFNKREEIIGGACMISIIGYLMAALFNDSVVSVAPLFWLILGLGISINIRLKSKINNTTQI